MSFYREIKKICKNYKNIAIFIDMDGTVVEYEVFPEDYITNKTEKIFLNARPLKPVIETIKKLNTIENVDIYILTLSKSRIIIEEKKEWLKKYLPFIKEENYIILCREDGDYNSDNREYIKSKKMIEKLDIYEYAILIDDEHKILKRTQSELKDKGRVYHVTSTII